MFCKCGTDSKSNFTKACRVGWHREEWFIHNWHSPPNQNYLLSSDTQQRKICSPVIVLSSNKVRQVFSFPLYMHPNDGCHGRDQHWPREERPLFLSFCFHSESWSFFFLFHLTEVAVMFKCRTTPNTLVEILSALHLALFLCSVWSQACTILCWIFSSEESSIKGALIIHDARFRFVPHCSETEKFSSMLLCRRAVDQLF